MPRSISEKLRIKKDSVLLAVNAPAEFSKRLPAATRIITAGGGYDQIHWFVTTQAQLRKEMSRVMKLLKEDVVVWVYYPKGSSGMQTDLTRDKGWDCLLELSGKLSWINLVSFDDTWSVFGFRPKTEADKKKDAVPKPKREIFNWVDPSTKQVKLPADLIAAFGKNKKLRQAFEALSFTNKKEYIEWIVTARREETRKERIAGTMERLAKGWKNPRNQ